MNIVLNEREWVEDTIANRQLGSDPAVTLKRVAKYYRQVNGYRKRDVRNKLENFVIQCDPDVLLRNWEHLLDTATSLADKHPLIELEEIEITEEEVAALSGLEGNQMRRLAFTLLCLAKYWNTVRPQNNGWVNTPDKEFMKMANINTSIKRQSKMLHDLREYGLIGFSKRVDNLNLQVKFIQPDSPTAIHISDFRNLGNQYMLFCGEPYLQCCQCGLTIRRKCNSQKYCPSCAADMYAKKPEAV